MISGNWYIIWNAAVSGYDATQYKIDFSIERCIFNKVKFIVLFYKSKM